MVRHCNVSALWSDIVMCQPLTIILNHKTKPHSNPLFPLTFTNIAENASGLLTMPKIFVENFAAWPLSVALKLHLHHIISHCLDQSRNPLNLNETQLLSFDLHATHDIKIQTDNCLKMHKLQNERFQVC